MTPSNPDLPDVSPELPKPWAPVNLDEALRTACEGVAGITSAQFQPLLSPEDVEDIAGGDIPVETLRAYALSFRGMGSGRGRITVLADDRRQGGRGGGANP